MGTSPEDPHRCGRLALAAAVAWYVLALASIPVGIMLFCHYFPQLPSWLGWAGLLHTALGIGLAGLALHLDLKAARGGLRPSLAARAPFVFTVFQAVFWIDDLAMLAFRTSP